jgi:hypothetical protein
MGGISYSGARRVPFLGGFPRAGRGGGILDWTDRGAGGCSATAGASAAHAEGADVESEARNDSTCGGYGVPVLWGAIVGAGVAVFVPGVRSGEEVGRTKLETRNLKLENRQAKNTGLKPPPLRGAGGVRVEAFFVEEEDAGAEGEEHDGDSGGDTEAGGHGCGTIVPAADDDMAGDDD